MSIASIKILICSIIICTVIKICASEDVLGCDGFIKSHTNIDYTKILIKLYTKAGILKDETECAPNGYYFLPLYDKGEYNLKVEPPPGWSFEPTEIPLIIDGTTGVCSQDKEINFTFKGFGIAGKVTSSGSNAGPKGVTVSLFKHSDRNNAVGTTTTDVGGTFYFTPIQPGKYVLDASHSSWVFEKSRVEVEVLEGNTELPDNVLVVFGYDVRGRIMNEVGPVEGVTFILFGSGKAKNCDTTSIEGFEKEKPLCHVTSRGNGRFVFPALTNGDYRIIPYYASARTKFDIQPTELTFKINHNSLKLSQEFEVTGFTVSGSVLTSPGGSPLEGAKVFISGRQVAVTDQNGIYTLEKMTSGQYTIKIEAPDVRFDDTIGKVFLSSPELPAIWPSSFKVCGTVTLSAKGTLHHRKIAVDKTASTFHQEIETDPKTGQYCLYLGPGKYQLGVIVTNEEKAKGLQFFPLQQTIDVSSKPINDINFSQLKAIVRGSVQCLKNSDCSQVSVTLKFLDGVTVKTLQAKDGRYEFTDVLPGYYEVLIDTDVFCWKNGVHRVSITSERAEVPPFEQTGFSVTFISSHATAVEYVEPGTSKKMSLELPVGSTRHCVSKSGKYNFVPIGCHIYKNSYNWDTHNLSPVILSSTKHHHDGKILSSAALDDVKINIKTVDTNTIIGPLKFVKDGDIYRYDFSFIASTDIVYDITPLSDILLFDPTIAKVVGINDCANDVAIFNGELGKIVSGKIVPVLEGVTIRIFGKDKEVPVHTLATDKDGAYRVGPLDGKIEYTVAAEKEGYVITGPDASGVFLAHKLAEVIVKVVDEADQKSLQGVLLSLSGGQSYRKNSVTGDDGKLVFNSLSPGEYFLRPMMKEYRFEPRFKVITVEEGLTVDVKLSGTRVAYSAYGSVTSLNGEPERGLLVEAQGQSDCSNLQEEATTEDNGSFRIRGLQPTCIYAIRLKPEAQANAHIQRVAPSSIAIQPTADVQGLRLIAFYPISRTDLSIHVVSTQPEHYRNLRVKLCRDDQPESPIHTYKLESHTTKTGSNYNSGYLIHLPPLQANGKKYFVQLESTLSQSLYKYKTVPIYFEANTSFKQISLKFHAERKMDQNEMSQTSIIALPFIMLVALAFLYRDKLMSSLNSQIEQWSKTIPAPRVPVPAIPIDPRADDIIVEQIMNINRRKTKPRKT
ncbi:nodal modulator 3 isoform X2 [Venturia canescens]|uniref:nodal modulator 3 isoform X2 n=1 Tax=Venturia canescens TaxID=32260 RepID=UPI001C9C5FFD|nr:nodal modulator 3 isoform X2 [Venturia canescens]